MTFHQDTPLPLSRIVPWKWVGHGSGALYFGRKSQDFAQHSRKWVQKKYWASTPRQRALRYKPDQQCVRWAIFAKRSLGEWVSVYAMAASDFTRPVHFFGDPEQLPFPRDATQCYYDVRLETSF